MRSRKRQKTGASAPGYFGGAYGEKMTTEKSTVEEIRARFDADVERFSDLGAGHAATIDGPLALDLVAEAAAVQVPAASAVLDVGCGAGNYTIKLLGRLPGLACTLLDLSRPMLDRAVQRVADVGGRGVTAVQSDVRDATFSDGSFDLILAASVLHHLRADGEWDAVFASFHRWLRPGGAVFIVDSVDQSSPEMQAMMWRRWGEYLAEKGGPDYRERVFAYVEKEDTPRPLVEQIDRLRAAGFVDADVLHKHNRFAAFGARKADSPEQAGL